MKNTLLASLAGALVATILIVACSDDGPTHIDAADAQIDSLAACDCPAAEPPVPPRLMAIRGGDSPLPANSLATPTASCPAGSKLITGHCRIAYAAGTPPESAITEFGPSDTDPLLWFCRYENRTASTTGTVHAEAVCLVP